jgi:glycosyltransferase involved in cell wall biosynthesis
MKLVVNAVAARQGGGAHHLGPFLSGLAVAMPDATLEVYAPTPQGTQNWPPRVHLRPTDVPPGLNLRRIAWDQAQMRSRLRGADCLVSPLNFGTLAAPVPQVLFQRNSVYFDPAYLQNCSRRERAALAAYRAFSLACIQMADAVIVPSVAMRQLLARHTRRLDHVRVIPHGFDIEDALSRADGTLPARAAPWADRTTRLLNVSHSAPNKNLSVLARVLHILVGRGHDAGLAVTVEPTDSAPVVRALLREAAVLGVTDRLCLLGPVPNEAVYPLYRAASVFVYPSVTESFGFPLLEALAVGAPVVASSIPSSREIAGGAAGYHEPADAEAAALLVEEAMAEGPTAVAARRDRARCFSWSRHCGGVASTIDDVTGEGRRTRSPAHVRLQWRRRSH